MNQYIMMLVVGILAAVMAALLAKYLPTLFSIITKIRIVKGLQIKESGITGIWKDRHNGDAIEAVREELRSASTNGEILMAGVGFPDFFRPNSDYANELSDLFQKPTFTLRVLLLDPVKDHAKERAAIEQGRFTILDIEGTISYLKQVKAQSSIAVHLYDLPPIAYLIITSECLFIEQYHYGPPRVDMGCTGGQTTFLRLHKNSTTYKVMKQHFEYMWANKSTKIVERP